MNRTQPDVGCIILTQPFFFDRADWIAPPQDWSRHTVVGKTMDSEKGEGPRIYRAVQDRLRSAKARLFSSAGEEQARYVPSRTNVRLGQGAFRVLVTNAYQRSCAVSGEKTLPVLEAAHIKPYAQAGPHLVQIGNGKIYYPFHGRKLLTLPQRRADYPDPSYLSWHNEKVYLG